MGSAVVETRALEKRYGQVRALRGIDLIIERGEILGFLGPNGAGKTTAIRLLLGLLRPSGGSARAFGLDCWTHAVEIKRRLGYLPGDVRFYDALTGEQLLELLVRLRGGDRAALRSRYRELAERLALDLGRRVKAYSKGNKQKLGLVQALMHRPDLLILDEPTSGLDPLIQEEVYRLLREENQRGATVFFSSHVLSEVDKICHRAAIVRQGRLLRIGPVDQLGDLTRRRVMVATKRHADLRAELERSGHRCEVQGEHVTLTVSEPGALLAVLARYPVSDLRIEPLSLEEIFLDIYRDGDAGNEAESAS
jgi:ABC-2 type transport system ATP-binding protein